MTLGGGHRHYMPEHTHHELWSKADHERFEDKLEDRLERMDDDIKGLGNRITLLLGALGLIAFLLPIIAPFIRLFLGVDVPSDR